jgi:hypothetical protein
MGTKWLLGKLTPYNISKLGASLSNMLIPKQYWRNRRYPALDEKSDRHYFVTLLKVISKTGFWFWTAAEAKFYQQA